MNSLVNQTMSMEIKPSDDLTLRRGFPPANKHDIDDEYFDRIEELIAGKTRIIAQQESEETSEKKQTTITMTSGRYNRQMEEDDGIKKKIRKKKKVILRTPAVSNHVTDELKEFVAREMNGSDMKLVIQKSLYAADLKRDQNRLSMPMNQVETHEFLTADEKSNLEKGGNMAVRLLGPTLRMHKESMVLRIWHLRSSSNYVLKTKWYDFVKENEEDLKEETKVQVWSFRRDQELCFAIACVERPPPAQNENDAAAA